MPLLPSYGVLVVCVSSLLFAHVLSALFLFCSFDGPIHRPYLHYGLVNRVSEIGSFEDNAMVNASLLQLLKLVNEFAWNDFEVLFELKFLMGATIIKIFIRIGPHGPIR